MSINRLSMNFTHFIFYTKTSTFKLALCEKVETALIQTYPICEGFRQI